MENISDDAKINHSEIFGPVVILIKYKHINNAINIANNSKSLINAGIFSNNLSNIQKAINKIEASSLMVNESSDFRDDNMPFGGFKYGSIGREGIKFAIKQLVQSKIICYNEVV